MEVSVIGQTHIDVIPYIAENTRICHNRENANFLKDVDTEFVTPEEDKKALVTVESALMRGHHSVFECIYLEWYVRNISRAATHQIVRHRMASYLQQSQRYVNYIEDDSFWKNMVMPDFTYINDDLIKGLCNSDKATKIFWKSIDHIRKGYTGLLNLGVRAEDARSLLPQCSPTTIKIGMNLREFLFNFYPLRSARGAQAEIKYLALKMMSALKDKYSKDDYFIKFLNDIYAKWLENQKNVRKEWC